MWSSCDVMAVAYDGCAIAVCFVFMWFSGVIMACAYDGCLRSQCAFSCG